MNTIQPTETKSSRKYKAEDFKKYTLLRTRPLVMFVAWGSNGFSYLRNLRVDTQSRIYLFGVGHTLTKGLWWKGEETGGVPKFF